VALASLHHVTCVCSDAQRTAAFYRDELGFSLVKKTVNFDDPHSYHLYFGDDDASPGSLLTFFEWPRADRGRLGRGTFESIGLVSPRVATEWQLEDPDGLRLRIVPGERPGLHDVVAIGNAFLYAGLLDGDAPLSFAPPTEEPALMGPGITHHIAWRAADDAEQALWQARLAELGLRPTGVQDRKYFRSIYFRMPDGILLEIATDGPGFDVDESANALGTSLSLPPWLEEERETLERELTPIARQAAR
jgi:glyoxalase family protein